MHILSGIFPPGLWICIQHTGLQYVHSSEGIEVYLYLLTWDQLAMNRTSFQTKSWNNSFFELLIQVGHTDLPTQRTMRESICVTVTEYLNPGNLKIVRASFSQLCKLEWSGETVQTGEGCSLLLEWFLITISSCGQRKEGWTEVNSCSQASYKGA